MKRLADNVKFQNKIILIFIGLFSIGIGNWEKYFILIFTGIVIWTHMNTANYTVSMRSQSVPLFLWGLTFFLMSLFIDTDRFNSFLYYTVAPICMCILGKDLVKNETYEQDFNRLTLIVGIGYFLHAALSIFSSVRSGLFQVNAEYIQDIWSGRLVSRTIMGMYMVPIVCLCIPRLVVWEQKDNLIKKIIEVIFVILPIGLSIYVGNRTLLIITAISILLSIYFGLRISSSKLRFVIIIISMVIIIITFVTLYKAQIEQFIGDSFLAKRNVSLQDDVRFEFYTSIMDHFTDYLGGQFTNGDSKSSIKWAHNIWLDTYIYVGLVPALLFIAYTLSVFRDTFFVMKNHNLQIVTRLFVIIYFIGVMLNWGVEPVLQANPYFVASCCFIFGMMSNLRKSEMY